MQKYFLLLKIIFLSSCDLDLEGLSEPPPNPINLVSKANSDTIITLRWTSGGGSTEGYQIAYQLGTVAPANCYMANLISNSSINGVSHSISGLSPNSTYSFRVCALNDNKNPNLSSGITSTSKSLKTPMSLTAVSDSHNQMTVNWTTGRDSTTGYRISYQEGSSAPTNCSGANQVSKNSTSETTHTFENLRPGRTYSFLVCYVNESSTVLDVASSTATTLSAPLPSEIPYLGLEALSTSTDIRIDWSSGGGSTVGYRLSYLPGSSSPTSCDDGITIDENEILGTSYKLGNLSEGQMYSFRICSTNDNPTPDVSAGKSLKKITALSSYKFSQITSGYFHTCGIRNSDSRVFCWGLGSREPQGHGVTANLSSHMAISSTDAYSSIQAGGDQTCGIRSSDSKLFCWGSGQYGKLGNGDTDDHYTPVAVNSTDIFSSIGVGESHTCAIRSSDGQVFCWGRGLEGKLGDGDTNDHSTPVAINSNEAFASISAGKFHTCGIRSSDGQVFCWGRGREGQLGDGDTNDHYIPVAINSNEAFASISAGEFHTCGIRSSDGQVFCWGQGFAGELGDGDTNSHSTPVAINSNDAFASITSNMQHTCGIRSSDSKVFCWGRGREGQLGDGNIIDQSSPVAVNSTDLLTSISVGISHTCGVRGSDNRVLCWGQGHLGQLGNSSPMDRLSPAPVNSSDTFASISTGSNHTCGIKNSDDRLYCWGSYILGHLSDDGTYDHSSPVAINSTDTFTSVSAGHAHTCAIRVDGKAFCWGKGKLGDGYTSERHTPVAVNTSETFTQISTYSGHTCGIKRSDGRVLCWGLGQEGQLGDGDTEDRLSPVAINSTDTFSTISAGVNHTCGIKKSDSQVLCWGDGAWGQLGDGDTDDHSSPVAINSTDTFSTISAGAYHTCAVRSSDGKVFCWGRSNHGQLGVGDTNNHSSPVAINSTDSFHSISAGTSHTCGVRSSDSKGFCWGDGRGGELGDGDEGIHYSPVPINSPDKMISIVVGENHSCGIRQSDNKVFCWGNVYSGSLGVGAFNHSTSPLLSGP